MTWRGTAGVVLRVALLCSMTRALQAQTPAVRDLVIAGGAAPVRLMGYGLVTGLAGTGDRAAAGAGARHTVQSVANLLARFGIDVPPASLRVRNVAAVLVTAEVSPYLRAGGRFDVRVSSIGDAQSLRGGVLWMTPLLADANGEPLAGAQGALLTTEALERGVRRFGDASNAGTIPGGGVLEGDLPRPQPDATARLALRSPDAVTAARIVAAIDSAIGGRGNAVVEDPGAILLTPRDTTGGLTSWVARVLDVRVQVAGAARVVIDARNGTVVAGGILTVGEGMVSQGGLTITVGEGTDSTATDGTVRLRRGTTVQAIVAALHGLRASAPEIAAILSALHDAGALAAEVVVR
ncbi:MAG: flagellar basal body P-ring protein FlgI [Gemmatimonadetes bacterium]|nr:flagellar basal body P-ring protein FlgI [Gemmatimonadota bacterium]